MGSMGNDVAKEHMALQAMDTNKDGLVSRAEYMAYYEDMFGKMKKDSAGMIDLKAMASASPAAK